MFKELKIFKMENEQIITENHKLSIEIREMRQKIDIFERQNLGASVSSKFIF